DQAAGMNASLPVRFAALVHDLGKGLTPADQLPRHVGHEKAGIEPIGAVCKRLRVSAECRDMALLVGEYHLHAHRALELRPATVVRLFERLDVFRRPERLAPFLLACEADRRGRLGRENEPYPQADLLSRAHAAAAAVGARTFDERGLEGPAIAQAVHTERVKRVAELKQSG